MTDGLGEPAERARIEDLPGWELVDAGLSDLAGHRETIAGELVRSASQRLRALGLHVPADALRAPRSLYDIVDAEVGARRAHARYNALRRRLASFLRAAGRAQIG